MSWLCIADVLAACTAGDGVQFILCPQLLNVLPFIVALLLFWLPVQLIDIVCGCYSCFALGCPCPRLPCPGLYLCRSCVACGAKLWAGEVKEDGTGGNICCNHGRVLPLRSLFPVVLRYVRAGSWLHTWRCTCAWHNEVLQVPEVPPMHSCCWRLSHCCKATGCVIFWLFKYHHGTSLLLRSPPAVLPVHPCPASEASNGSAWRMPRVQLVAL